MFNVQVLNATNTEPVADNQTGEQSNLPISALPEVDVVSTTKYVCLLLTSFDSSLATNLIHGENVIFRKKLLKFRIRFVPIHHHTRRL